jgi:hypothetical protein
MPTAVSVPAEVMWTLRACGSIWESFEVLLVLVPSLNNLNCNPLAEPPMATGRHSNEDSTTAINLLRVDGHKTDKDARPTVGDSNGSTTVVDSSNSSRSSKQ